jgi:hypothetical protein
MVGCGILLPSLNSVHLSKILLLYAVQSYPQSGLDDMEVVTEERDRPGSKLLILTSSHGVEKIIITKLALFSKVNVMLFFF